MNQIGYKEIYVCSMGRDQIQPLLETSNEQQMWLNKWILHIVCPLRLIFNYKTTYYPTLFLLYMFMVCITPVLLHSSTKMCCLYPLYDNSLWVTCWNHAKPHEAKKINVTRHAVDCC